MLRFKEKPDEIQARAMLAGGDHDWNSGMFVWKVERILAEFERQMPELSSAMQAVESAMGTDEQTAVLQRVWPALKIETIDYGIMERAEQVAVVPAAGLGWSDVGSWDSLFDVIDPDQEGNIIMGEQHIGLDTSGSLVYVGDACRLIVTIGVKNLIVVDTGDALLICDREQAQKVRQLVTQLKHTDRSQFI